MQRNWWIASRTNSPSRPSQTFLQTRENHSTEAGWYISVQEDIFSISSVPFHSGGRRNSVHATCVYVRRVLFWAGKWWGSSGGRCICSASSPSPQSPPASASRLVEAELARLCRSVQIVSCRAAETAPDTSCAISANILSQPRRGRGSVSAGARKILSTVRKYLQTCKNMI